MPYNTYLCPKRDCRTTNTLEMSKINNSNLLWNVNDKGQKEIILEKNNKKIKILVLDADYWELFNWKFLNSPEWKPEDFGDSKGLVYQVLHWENYLIIAVIKKTETYDITIRKYNLDTESLCDTDLEIKNCSVIRPLNETDGRYLFYYENTSDILNLRNFIFEQNNQSLAAKYNMNIQQESSESIMLNISCYFEMFKYEGSTSIKTIPLAALPSISNITTDMLFQILKDQIEGKSIPGYSMEFHKEPESDFIILTLVMDKHYFVEKFHIYLYREKVTLDVLQDKFTSLYRHVRNKLNIGHYLA